MSCFGLRSFVRMFDFELLGSVVVGACSDQKCSRWNGYCSRSFEASKNSTQKGETGSTVGIIIRKRKRRSSTGTRKTINDQEVVQRAAEDRLNHVVNPAD